MAHILIIGGYGVFGGRLAQLLLRDGHHVTIAGRSFEKAQAFCATYGGQPRAFNCGIDAPDLTNMDLLIDATGPFQGRVGEYELARAAIAAGVHYFDLSDDAAFTAGISTLDAVAKTAGVAVLSGVSSVPAISGAAVGALSQDFTHIEDIQSAILPGNRAPRGYSVMAAILAQVGNPLKLIQAGRSVEVSGWSDPKMIELAPGLRRRAYRIGAPDLTLFPNEFQADSVSFRAGLELSFMGHSLALLGQLRRRKLISNLSKFTAVFLGAAKLVERFATDIGGMQVSVTGTTAGVVGRKIWTLIARGGDGPFVPGIAARVLAGRLPELPVGARPCIHDLTLAQVQYGCRDLQIEFHQSGDSPPLLFAQVTNFDTLPVQVQELHQVTSVHRFSGQATITQGRGFIPRLIHKVMRFPPAQADTPVTITMRRIEGGELWVRDFNGHQFQSILRRNGDEITERFGPLTFTLGLHVNGDALHFPVKRGVFLGIPIPRICLPRSVACERVVDGLAQFDVALYAPFGLGLIVHYKGCVTPVTHSPLGSAGASG